MTGDPHVDRALRLLRRESEALARELEGLGADDWDRLSNCPPWTVRALMGHTIRSGESYLAAIERGRRGDLEMAHSAEERARRQQEIAAQEPSKIVADLRAMTDRFEREIAALGPAGLEVLGRHPYGPRPVRWFVDQRLAEVAFHRLDLHASLGRAREPETETAAHLLPMLLEQNMAPMMGQDWPRGSGAFRFVVTGEPSAAWLVRASPGALTVDRRGDAAADLTIEGDPAALALLVYGRRALPELAGSGRIRVTGDRHLAARFHEIFKGP